MAREKASPDVIQECRRRAAQARRMADALSDSPEKRDIVEIERRWLALARSYESNTVERPSRRKLRRNR